MMGGRRLWRRREQKEEKEEEEEEEEEAEEEEEEEELLEEAAEAVLEVETIDGFLLSWPLCSDRGSTLLQVILIIHIHVLHLNFWFYHMFQSRIFSY
jgi:hypothetical protein